MVMNLVTGDSKAVLTEINTVVESYSKASKSFANLFVALCERFPAKDNMSGDLLQHLLNKLEANPILRGKVANRLRDWSDNTLLVTFDEGTKAWSVQTKKDDDKKSLFKKDHFIAQVAAAKSSANALTYKPDSEPATPAPKRFNAAKAEKKISDNLADFAVKLMEAEKLSPEKLAIKLEAMLKLVLADVKPVIEAEPAEKQ